eukprot:TRINITY_DN2583_c0_g2_i8.p3 TRINITY_DN2583_c0_g2~~TRINITY_DN2583_c0_g2_i8.p3  ORF type:complete len:204 (+),score=-27.64 TRINITY_DN2583_c0_g2_i8:274-885(+)
MLINIYSPKNYQIRIAINLSLQQNIPYINPPYQQQYILTNKINKSVQHKLGAYWLVDPHQNKFYQLPKLLKQYYIIIFIYYYINTMLQIAQTYPTIYPRYNLKSQRQILNPNVNVFTYRQFVTVFKTLFFNKHIKIQKRKNPNINSLIQAIYPTYKPSILINIYILGKIIIKFYTYYKSQTKLLTLIYSNIDNLIQTKNPIYT